jgi:hypothetical protein
MSQRKRTETPVESARVFAHNAPFLSLKLGYSGSCGIGVCWMRVSEDRILIKRRHVILLPLLVILLLTLFAKGSNDDQKHFVL